MKQHILTGEVINMKNLIKIRNMKMIKKLSSTYLYINNNTEKKRVYTTRIYTDAALSLTRDPMIEVSLTDEKYYAIANVIIFNE